MQIREMPNHLRTGKKAFKAIVDAVNPGIGFANSSSTISISNLFQYDGIITMIRDELNSPYSKNIFPEHFLSFILSKLQIDKNTGPWPKS